MGASAAMMAIKGVTSSQLMMASAGISAIGSIAQVRSAQAAANRNAYRIETETKMAALAAVQEENARNQIALKERANNSAYQSIAGYADDSMSFLNINKQVESTRIKDISDIRLMGKSVQTKYRQQLYELNAQSKDLTFGGYADSLSSLVNGYSNYKYYKNNPFKNPKGNS